jgi:ABC-type lipopolysaccharide export system ATPase subunit
MEIINNDKNNSTGLDNNNHIESWIIEKVKIETAMTTLSGMERRATRMARVYSDNINSNGSRNNE